MFGLFSSGRSNAAMENHLFNLRYTAKQMNRLSAKCTKEEAQEKAKLKKALQQGNHDGARIYAQNAIRKRSESLNYLKMSSRLDAVASRVQTAVTMNDVSRSMAGVVTQMDKAMQSMDLEKIQAIMQKFEQQFDDLDVRVDTMEDAMGSSTATMIPGEQVDTLIMQVADENGLEVNMSMANAPFGVPATQAQTSSNREQDELSQRLARLRNES
ncbi:hypothetical protein H696_06183 [Fonticula alba]|uniref:Charged multivesicular body protein 1 n=1 Tax=Fonticula alba TaxID=691883 RepID=A0A058YZH7_FONAL|nr:hypothetical protein H696_06183 [Fonticula alba]KCV67390.1 hypothetical protein H696_06183 [Fonticula alba]|eukprot:XP_009498201.1 hypothetical protein H696_06183 [Fonticula alba]